MGIKRRAGVGDGVPAASTVFADQMYQSARSMQLRGSLGIARQAYRDFLRAYPSHPLAPSAILYIGDTFAAESPDSAAHYYEQVVF